MHKVTLRCKFKIELVRPFLGKLFNVFVTMRDLNRGQNEVFKFLPNINMKLSWFFFAKLHCHKDLKLDYIYMERRNPILLNYVCFRKIAICIKHGNIFTWTSHISEDIFCLILSNICSYIHQYTFLPLIRVFMKLLLDLDRGLL